MKEGGKIELVSCNFTTHNVSSILCRSRDVSVYISDCFIDILTKKHGICISNCQQALNEKSKIINCRGTGISVKAKTVATMASCTVMHYSMYLTMGKSKLM
jgi:hypothetical protein